MESGISLKVVQVILNASVDPTLVLEIDQCTWVKETKVLTAPHDAEDDGKLSLEKAAWYNNDFRVKLSKRKTDMVSKKHAQLMKPDDIYQIDDEEHTYTTLNDCPGTYAGSPGAVRLDLGRSNQEPVQLEVSGKNDDDASNLRNLTGISDYSLRDLYNKCKQLEITIQAQKFF